MTLPPPRPVPSADVPGLFATTEEAAQGVRKLQCATDGHSYYVLNAGGAPGFFEVAGMTPHPVGLECGSCGESWDVAKPLAVDAAQVAYAIGRALDDPATEAEFWMVIDELSKAVPNISWHNLATDSPGRRAR